MKKVSLFLLSFIFMSSLVFIPLHATASTKELSPLSETKDNDSFETATPIVLNRQYTGKIENYNSSAFDSNSSYDYYKFTLPADGNIIVSILNQEGKNWYIDILTPERIFNTLYSNNFAMETIDPTTKSNKIEVGLPAGTYYIKISGSAETVDIPYYFETTYLQHSSFEKEPNDTIEEATPLQLNQAYSGVIEDYYAGWPSSGSSDDYYVFTLNNKTEITAGIKSKRGSTWFMVLTNAKGDQLLKLYSDENQNSIASTVVSLDAGTYFLRMNGYNDADDKVYRFMISNEGVKSLSALNDISLYIDGVYQSFSQPPLLKSGTTLVPMRAIFEKLGATVTWNSKAKVITAKKNDTEIILTIDSNEAIVNNQKITLAQPAKIISGTTIVPLRFVSEALGATIIWFPDTTTIYIDSQ